MWLLNAETRQLEEFAESSVMKDQYAILSHTWEVEEIRFDEIHLQSSHWKEGYRKIDLTCKQAVKDGLKYAWIDTCCIDKRSSAELSEAINSMYRWYHDARICYAFLSDTVNLDRADYFNLDHLHNDHILPNKGPDREQSPNHDKNRGEDETRAKTCFSASRWFSRGWTLQELIAPADVRFYDSEWNPCGTKHERVEVLAKITGIDAVILEDRDAVNKVSIAKRMSWVSSRSTTRLEDIAYCMLGIFGVNMPLLYGEGARAFTRLQEEIIRTNETVDHSILAWEGAETTLLAPHPSRFRSGKRLLTWRVPQRQTFDLSNGGLRVTLHVRAAEDNSSFDASTRAVDNSTTLIAVLNCADEGARSSHIAIRLLKRPRVDSISSNLYVNTTGEAATHADEAVYDRISFSSFTVSSDEMPQYLRKTITIGRTAWSWPEWQHKLKISSSRSLPHVHLGHPAYYRRTTSPFDRKSRILSLSQNRRTTLLISASDHVDIWCSFNLRYGFVGQMPQLFLSCLEDRKDALWSIYSEMPQGRETVLVQNGQVVLKVTANVVAFEGEFMWNLDFAASSIYEVEGREIFSIPRSVYEQPVSTPDGSETAPQPHDLVQPTSSSDKDDGEDDGASSSVYDGHESIHRAVSSHSERGHDEVWDGERPMEETSNTIDDDDDQNRSVEPIPTCELDADDAKPGMRSIRTAWPYSKQFPIEDSDSWRHYHEPLFYYKTAKAALKRLETLLKLEWKNKDPLQAGSPMSHEDWDTPELVQEALKLLRLGKEEYLRLGLEEQTLTPISLK